MGLCNNSPYTFKSGPTCTGTYMRVNTSLHCVMGSDGKLYAQGTLMTYYNGEARINKLDPMEIGDINLEIDPSGVFKVVFEGLKQKFTNCTDAIDPVIEQLAESAAATTAGTGADTAAPSEDNANAEAFASTCLLSLIEHAFRSVYLHHIPVTFAIIVVALLRDPAWNHKEVRAVACMCAFVVVTVASHKEQLERSVAGPDHPVKVGYCIGVGALDDRQHSNQQPPHDTRSDWAA